MANHHILKTHGAAYRAVQRGDKTFEVRRDDRMFQTGDRVTLTWVPNGTPPGAPQGFAPAAPPFGSDKPDLDFKIGFVLRGGQYGIEPGYVAFSLAPLDI
jgi:hypothetical protein